MAKFEVKICYSGYVVKEVEADSEYEAYDMVQNEFKANDYTLTEEENEQLLDSLERWDEADQINKIE
jgi:hypothetical protein